MSGRYRCGAGRVTAVARLRHSPLTARSIASAEMARDTWLNLGSEPKISAGFGRQRGVDERAVHQDHSQNERFRRVEGGRHLISGVRDDACVRAAALDLDEAKASRSRVTAFDLVATIFG